MAKQTLNQQIEASLDAYTPAEVARRAQQSGVAKATMPLLTTLVLAVLAGAFISLGGMFYLVVVTQSELGWGITRLVGGLSFSLGLLLVVVAGAELFTGNNLIAMAWASGYISSSDLMRNWLLVYAGNVVGCLATVGLVLLADTASLNEGAVSTTAVQVALAKTELTVVQGFARGVLCNALVCLAVWLAMAGRSVTDKTFAVLFPITAFVALGLEHSIANWFFLPLGILLASDENLTIAAAAYNLFAVTAGNIVGGTLLVAAVYWLAYIRPTSKTIDG